MLKCNQICPWNYSSIGIGCKKPDDELCPMSNVREKPKTNADRIRAMSDEELAWFMADRNVNESTLLLLDKDHGLTAVEKDALRHNIYYALRNWLKQPAEGE